MQNAPKQKRRPGETLDHYQIEKDIHHLEQIINHISANDPLPLSYWRNRVKTVAAATMVPAQRERVNRLNEALALLETRWNKAREQDDTGGMPEPEGT